MHINDIIKSRRSIFPKMYSGEAVSDEIVQQLLENANWAPNHRHTEPWRFKVYTDTALARLGDKLAELYKQYTPIENFQQKKYEKIARKPRQSSHVIAICMQRDPKETLPEWEEMCAVACAVQNIWLTAASYDVGGYWSSPKLTKKEEMREFLGLKSDEKCMGFFYLGHYDGKTPTSKRQPVEEKTEWVRD